MICNVASNVLSANSICKGGITGGVYGSKGGRTTENMTLEQQEKRKVVLKEKGGTEEIEHSSVA